MNHHVCLLLILIVWMCGVKSESELVHECDGVSIQTVLNPWSLFINRGMLLRIQNNKTHLKFNKIKMETQTMTYKSYNPINAILNSLTIK